MYPNTRVIPVRRNTNLRDSCHHPSTTTRPKFNLHPFYSLKASQIMAQMGNRKELSHECIIASGLLRFFLSRAAPQAGEQPSGCPRYLHRSLNNFYSVYRANALSRLNDYEWSTVTSTLVGQSCVLCFLASFPPTVREWSPWISTRVFPLLSKLPRIIVVIVVGMPKLTAVIPISWYHIPLFL